MLSAARIPVLALGGSLAVVGIFAAVLSDPEWSVGQAFAHAFDKHSPRVAAVAVARNRDISRLDPAMLHFSTFPQSSKPMAALGDLVSFSNADGAVRSYRVTDVRPLSTPATGEFGSLSGGLVLVTAEADKTGAGGTAQIVRFIVESPVAPVPVSTSVKPHAL